MAETRPQLFALAAGDPDLAVRVAAVRALARPGAPADEPPAPFVELIAGLPAETPAVREALLDLALAAPDRTAALLDLIDAGELSPAAVGPARVRRLADHADPAVRARAAELFAPAGEPGGGAGGLSKLPRIGGRRGTRADRVRPGLRDLPRGRRGGRRRRVGHFRHL